MPTSQTSEWSANAVRQAITDSGRTKRAIAESAGIPYTTLNRKLAGGSDFTLRELFLLAEATGVEPSRLVPPRHSARARR